MQYERFHPLLDKTAKDIREIMAKNRHFCDKVFGHHIKKVSPRNLLTRAALDLLSPCNSPDATMRTIVLSEAEWDDEGRRIFFPLPGLIESVYRANMNVRYEDFSLPAEAFAVAVPKGTAVGGIEIPAFLVSASTCEKNRRYAKKLSARIGIEVEPEPQPEGSVSICFNLRGTSKKLCFNSQRETIVSILGTGTATDGIEAVSSFVGERGPNGRPASDEEAKILYVLLKTLVHLCVYMTSFPQSLKEGYPEQYSRDGTRDKAPSTVGTQHFGGSHASPHGHYRTWHFRSYPVKKDGTRTPGIVDVKETWVNRDSERPATVIAA